VTLRLLRAKDRVAQPWKNGGGVTREIAVHPPGAGFDDFCWRISTAIVDASGPFSRFDGVDRVLVLLEGAGLDLAIEGREMEAMTTASEPVAFPADVPVEATLSNGGVTDLNIMTRRGVWTSKVTRRNLSSLADVRCGADACCFVMSLDACTLRGDFPDPTLRPGDALLLRPGEVVRLFAADGPCRLIVVELSRLA
jgi:environmental stress-induced protein Ves